jgi:hypothetical protein
MYGIVVDMHPTIEKALSVLKDHIQLKQDMKEDYKEDNPNPDKDNDVYKAYIRLLTTEILLGNSILKRSNLDQIKRLQTINREAMLVWMEIVEENDTEGKYLVLANHFKDDNDFNETLINILVEISFLV